MTCSSADTCLGVRLNFLECGGNAAALARFATDWLKGTSARARCSAEKPKRRRWPEPYTHLKHFDHREAGVLQRS